MAMAFNGFVGLGKETTRGTRVNRTRWIRFESADSQADLGWIIPKHSQSRYEHEALPGPVMAPVTATVEVRPDAIGELLRTLLWVDPITVSVPGAVGAVKDHVFVVPAQTVNPTPKPYTTEMRMGTAAKSRITDGCVGDQGTFSWERDMLKCAFELFGFRPGVLDSPSTPTFGSERPFLFHQLMVLQRKLNTFVNSDFETWTTSPGVPDGYTDMSGGDAVFSKELTIKRGAGQSAKVLAGATPTATEGFKQALPVIAGEMYDVEVFAATGGGTMRAKVVIFNVTDTTVALELDGTAGVQYFERLSGQFTAVTGKTYEVRFLHFGTPTTGDAVYFDDFTRGQIRAVRSGQIQVAGNPTKEFASGSQYSETPEAGVMPIEMQLTQRLDDLTDLRDEWSLHTAPTDSPDGTLAEAPYYPFLLRWTGGLIPGETVLRYEIEFLFPKAQIGNFSAPMQAQSQIVQTLTLKALYEDVHNSPLIVRLRNKETAY